jgi:phycoerythrin alpha chain
MRVLVDADLVLELFTNRAGYAEAAETLLSVTALGTEQFYVTDQCLEKVCFYLGKPDPKLGLEAAARVAQMVNGNIILIQQPHIEMARNLPLEDFDAAVEVACAKVMHLHAIVTHRPKTFDGSQVPIWTIDDLMSGIGENKSRGLELEAVKASIQKAAARMEAAENLAINIDSVAKEAFDAVFKIHSYLSQVGEAGDTQLKRHKCLRDIHHHLRIVQYSLVVGGTGPLDEWSIAGCREVYRALNLPTAPFVTAMEFIRNRNRAPLDMSAHALIELNAMLDYVINSFS